MIENLSLNKNARLSVFKCIFANRSQTKSAGFLNEWASVLIPKKEMRSFGHRSCFISFHKYCTWSEKKKIANDKVTNIRWNWTPANYIQRKYKTTFNVVFMSTFLSLVRTLMTSSSKEKAGFLRISFLKHIWGNIKIIITFIRTPVRILLSPKAQSCVVATPVRKVVTYQPQLKGKLQELRN